MSSHQQVTKHAHLQYEKIRNAHEFLNNAHQNSYRTITLCMKKKVFEPNTQYMHACMHTNTHIVAAKKAHKNLYLAYNCTYEGRGTYTCTCTIHVLHVSTQHSWRTVTSIATHCITCKGRMTYNINNALGYSVCPQLLQVPSSLYKKEKDFVNSQGCSIKSTQNSLLSYMFMSRHQ